MEQIPPGTNLFLIPYKPAPPGVKSDFTKPSDLLILFRILVPVVICITTLFTGFRIRARSGRNDRWKMDDWLTIATWITTTALGILLVVCVQRLGRPTWDISLGTLLSPWPQRVLVCMAFLVPLSLLLGKLCLLALYRRFFGHIDKVRRQLYLVGALCFPLLCACVILPTLAAPPPGKPWGTANPHSGPNSITAMTIGVNSIIVDLLIFYIPIPIIMQMNLSSKKKGGVLAIFLTGLIAIFADAIVMYYRVRLWKQVDPLRDGMIVGLCSFIEACISIVCSSMPCAAQVWKVHISSSDLYLNMRSRFTSDQRSDNHSCTNKANNEEIGQAQKRRKGPYSIGTFPTTNCSVTQLSKVGGFVELESFEEQNSIADQSEDFDRKPTCDKEANNSNLHTQSSVVFNDPSNFLRPEHHN